ncbi:hypothetical protein K505DRAFT_325088 [Melanomma pulvis-pyrius CBS 109.77]|uniref:Uncharacterized protein n=1 Tax=Melanomma pulvis-pyrius CBS 109.77 TaxID=1314802 RepID=A0A6A6XBX5_9PLEO|nr:hypothetical protein K505DRAFT_325088 [Melanomma pulvis-pyrius CBS 109.77]
MSVDAARKHPLRKQRRTNPQPESTCGAGGLRNDDPALKSRCAYALRNEPYLQ